MSAAPAHDVTLGTAFALVGRLLEALLWLDSVLRVWWINRRRLAGPAASATSHAQARSR